MPSTLFGTCDILKMPASTLDPVTSLRSALTSISANNSLDSQIVATNSKSLLSKIEFEKGPNFEHELNKWKSNCIVLKNESDNGKQLKAENMGAEDALTGAKYELFPLNSVQLGWTNSDWSVGAGMVNMGNTCYLNSTLQALFHVPSLVNWLMSEKQHMTDCENSGGTLCIICAVRKTLHDSQQRNTTSIRPYLIYNKLRILCKNLIPGRQEDAHEFLRYLVEAMEKAYLNRFKNNTEFDSRIKETTPLNQILGGYLRSAVRCLECGTVSTTYQHFQDLLLDIRKVQTLDDALESFFSREKLDDDSYHCATCKKKVPAWKQFTLERAPMVLCVQLKRFSICNNKITKHVQFRQKLDLTKYVRRRLGPLTYKLVALVTHMGPTAGCGHYTAIAQAPSGSYYQFDDGIVKPISHNAVFSTNAYIMFYELERPPLQLNGKLKISSPISTITQSNDVKLPSSTTQVNGEIKKYQSTLAFTKLQKPIGIGQNGVSFTLNENKDTLNVFNLNKQLEIKTVQKENKPVAQIMQASQKLCEIVNTAEFSPTSTSKSLNGTLHDNFTSNQVISSSNISNSTEIKVVNNKSSSITATKLVPYDMDDSSKSSDDDSEANSKKDLNSSETLNSSDWKVTSSTDNQADSSTKNFVEKKSDVVTELLKMSHNGYSAPVMSWNGNRSQLDKEVTNEKRLDRKRIIMDDTDLKPRPPKHPKMNISHNSNSNYNIIQDYHNSRNRKPNNDTPRYRMFYNSDKRHRNDRRNYHHKNYHKIHRFRH